MRDAWKHFTTSTKRPVFPEFLLLITIGILWLLCNTPTVYKLLAGGLLFATLLTIILAIFRPKQLSTTVAVLMLLSLTNGLMQFDYIPALTLWLLCFLRLVQSTRRDAILLILITLTTTIFASLTATLYLPSIALDYDHQMAFNIICLFITVIITGFHIWRLISLVHDARHKLSQQKQRTQSLVNITNQLARFLPPQVWQPIIHKQSLVEVSSQRRKITILFSDIVGFTDLSDKISADHLAHILNTYLDRMTQITLKHGATLDKFIGDGLLCYFGDSGNHNEREDAISCANMALEMRREMQTLRQQWRLLGFEGLYVRMGINTGYCYVGNFGSHNRMTYTVIGKEANLAARLESAAQKNQILISESTYHLISHEHLCQPIGELSLKGIQETTKAWALSDPDFNTDHYAKWVDYQLPGFNLQLNVQDIHNYDRRSITNYLIQALDLIEKKTETDADTDTNAENSAKG